MRPRQLGDIRLARILEREMPEFQPTELLPDATPERLAPHRGWLEPKALDSATGKLILPVQSYVVRTRHHNILIDACLGEEKTDRSFPPWDKLRDSRFPGELAALGLAPEDIDFVLCTHLHSDHVGWNTRRVDGRWVPTFPKARYVMSRREVEHAKTRNASGDPEAYSDALVESVLPVIAAGQSLLVAEDHALDDEVRLEPLPGHTAGHFGVRLASRSARAIMIGDMMHSPVQCAEPDWVASSDLDPAAGRATRRRFLESHAETDCLVLTAHFPSPSVGHIGRMGDAFRFLYAD
jgi:glyoxylase-like metal-dependent hydrolase (beta-lactamase superfamily II)